LYLAGAFSDKNAAIQAINQLKANGLAPEDLAIFSDEPVELPRGVLDRPSRMSLIVVSGAVISFLLIVSVVYFTQHNYPLVTGGMPIFSFWPTAVVFYEITMLGAILTTAACFLWESGLLRRDRTTPIPVIEPEMICLRVRCSTQQYDQAAAVLTNVGAPKVVKLELKA
jgi:hypothetical protein